MERVAEILSSEGDVVYEGDPASLPDVENILDGVVSSLGISAVRGLRLCIEACSVSTAR